MADGEMGGELVETAATLYALPLDRFTAARNAAAATARSDGDKELAAALKALPKPSSSAWLVNVLVDRRRAQVEQVIELGVSLKEAQAGMDRAQLHALGQQRQRLLAAVARESLEAASDAGHTAAASALPGVEQTLRAALADPSAAAAVLTGRLVRTLEASGWDAVDLEGAVGGPFTPPESSDTESDTDGDAGTASDTRPPADARSAARAARRRKQAVAALSAARESREAAESEARQAQELAGRTTDQRERVAASISDLEQELERLRREHDELQKQHTVLTLRVDEAAAELTEARRDEESARAAVEHLDE